MVYIKPKYMILKVHKSVILKSSYVNDNNLKVKGKNSNV